MADTPGNFPVYLGRIPIRMFATDGPRSITRADAHMRPAMRNRSASLFWRRISAIALSIISKRKSNWFISLPPTQWEMPHFGKIRIP